MKLLSLDEVRQLQISLLSDFDSFCKTNNMTYYLYYGTLLGAIRHKGMIPWDNDIDVAMPRDDYDKLILLMREENPGLSFRFLCYENYPEYLWPHGRISIKNTFMKTAGMYALLGLSIDIFPLDNQGNTKDEAIKLMRQIKEYDQLRIMSYEHKYKTVTVPSDNPLWSVFEKFGDKKEKYWVEKEIEASKTYSNLNEATAYYGSNTDGVYCITTKSKWFKERKFVEFEGMMSPVPSGWNEILTAYYKDYMTLPPIEKRNKVNNMKIFELTSDEMQYAIKNKYFYTEKI